MKRKSKYNKSTYFLLPLLQLPFYEFNQANDGLIDTFAFSDFHSVIPPRTMCVLLRRSKIDFDVFNKVIYTKQLYSRYISLMEYLFIYTLPKEFDEDYRHFINGKYSKFSDKAKSMIGNYIRKKLIDENTGRTYNNENWVALFPNDESRRTLEIMLKVDIAPDAEVLSSIYIEDETLPLTAMLTDKTFKLIF